jgi:hypothetical protein
LGKRALLVDARQPAIASDIGRQNGREPPLQSLASQGAPLIARENVYHAPDYAGHEVDRSSLTPATDGSSSRRPVMSLRVDVTA